MDEASVAESIHRVAVRQEYVHLLRGRDSADTGLHTVSQSEDLSLTSVVDSVT